MGKNGVTIMALVLLSMLVVLAYYSFSYSLELVDSLKDLSLEGKMKQVLKSMYYFVFFAILLLFIMSVSYILVIVRSNYVVRDE